jgi:pimeloyl-ACP methyl ester carboxylesterase
MRRIAITVLVLIAVLALWLLAALPPRDLESVPRPARGYAEALERIETLRAEDSPAIAPECRTRLLTHGAPTPRVVVLLHGLTNCPAQFDSLARMSFARGANVLIPRLPRHGFADRMSDAPSRANARELCIFVDRVLDAAQGLGDSVTVAGLSVGGTLAAWAAQHRPGLDRAVLIAPMIGVARVGGGWTPVVSRLAGALPNAFIWWDPVLKQHLRGPTHVYPRFATRSVAATLELGWMTVRHALDSAPRCHSIVMVTVGGDAAVDNGLCAKLVRTWRAHGVRDLVTYEFPADLHLSHDVVDPEQVNGNPAITYPVLSRLIGP